MTASAPAASPAPPQVLLAHHLRQLKLPTFLREYEKLAAEAAREGLDYVRFLLRLAELERLAEAEIAAFGNAILSEGFLECRSAAGQLDVDPVAFYSADKTAIDVVSETASNVRHTLARVGRTDEANLIGEVCAAADTIVPLLWNFDTTTDGDVVIDAGSAGPEPADNSADPFIAVCAPVRRLRSRFELALTRLRRRKGPEARVSLGLVVSQLCDLWRRETGRSVTANPVRLRSYTSRPQSASGWFVCEAVEALQPTAAWIATRRSEPTCAPQS
jgi:hypothetical protein